MTAGTHVKLSPRELRLVRSLVPTPADYCALAAYCHATNPTGGWDAHDGGVIHDDDGAPILRMVRLEWDGALGVHIAVDGLDHEDERCIHDPSDVAAVRRLIERGLLESDDDGEDTRTWRLTDAARELLL